MVLTNEPSAMPATSRSALLAFHGAANPGRRMTPRLKRHLDTVTVEAAKDRKALQR